MDDVMTVETPEEIAKWQKLIAEAFLELQRMREKGQKDMEEIDRMKAKTRATLAQMDAAASPRTEECQERQAEEIKELRQDNKALHEENRSLREALQRLAYEIRRSSETEAHEREKLELRLKNELLAALRNLPQTTEPPALPPAAE